MKDRYLNLLGIAYRAGKCIIGEEAIIKSIQHKKAKVVLIAEDIGESTKKKITDKCKTYNIPCIMVDNREILSQAIGQVGRVAIAIEDKGFSKKMLSYFT